MECGAAQRLSSERGESMTDKSGGRPRYYVGLATTFHDPALAIVGPEGEVLFAEATERYLQYKRAINCEPDSIPRMAGLLAEYVPADAELCVATSWGEGFSSYLGRSAASGLFDFDRITALPNEVNAALAPESTERAYLAALHLRQAGAGLGTVIGMERAFGAVRMTGLRRYRHHESHAALAAFGSPFDEAAVLVVDGVGESGSVSLFHYSDGRLGRMPGAFGTLSPGLLYSLLTELCGFDPMAGEEWKVMGLAPFGRPEAQLAALTRQLFRTDKLGRPLRPTTEAVQKAVAALTALRPAEAGGQGWADLARAAQDTFVEVMDRYVAEVRRRLPVANLVLTGGCALNSSYNGQIAGRHGWEHLYVPSAPADDGNALGAALLAWSDDHPGRRPDLGPAPLTPYLGSAVSTRPLERMRGNEPRLVQLGATIVEHAAELLADGLLVGWVQGRAEFGPRALGNRSILADPRPADARDTINAKVKYREAFRPFAPSILAEKAGEWFEDAQPSPYMDRTLTWKPSVRDRVPAVVHEDGTGRLQTVTGDGNPRFHELLVAFERLTGVPVLLNTSLNVMGKPIAHSTEDALTLFYTTGLDALVVDDWLVLKHPVS
jgi:carbamoyltransferase